MASHGLIVQKYGGNSLRTPEHIGAIAERIHERAREKARLVVVVSAMGQTTDELTELAYKITPDPPQRELDMLLTVGERITMALLSMALSACKCEAISFTGSQSGIVTSSAHLGAVIHEIRPERIQAALSDGKVVIVAGFQGVSREREITTLGRGGSDTTAVALAAELGAERCEVYSNYPGVFTADPRLVSTARPIETIDYDTMYEMAALGSTVLHHRAAALARTHHVPLVLLASSYEPGATRVNVDAPAGIAAGVTLTEKASVWSFDGSGASLDGLVTRLGGGGIPILLKRLPEDRRMTLVIDAQDDDGMRRAASEDGSLRHERRGNASTVSVVGASVVPAAPAKLTAVLEKAGISTEFCDVSPLSATAVVPVNTCRDAVQALHSSFIEG